MLLFVPFRNGVHFLEERSNGDENNSYSAIIFFLAGNVLRSGKQLDNQLQKLIGTKINYILNEVKGV